MDVHLISHMPAEAAKRRSAAYWFSLAAALALSWTFQSVALGPAAARADGIHGCAPDLQVAGPATLYQNAQVLVWSTRDLQAFARNDQPPLDEPNDILVAPRVALSIACAPGAVAETVCADLRVGFTRSFNPRAPPSPQA
jgi:hypothetical protein